MPAETRLRWVANPVAKDDLQNWSAMAGRIHCLVLDETHEGDDERPFYWRCAHYEHGRADSLLAAQLAAEDAALSWLTEGVIALGGRVLTGEQVALCVEALGWCAGDQPRSKRDTAEAMLALAKELADG